MDLRFWILDCSGLVLFFEIYAESGLGYDEVPETRKGYTGYEKDEESGLDFAQARYYNPKHGRYTSVDPLTASANVKNPQTFNRYSYVLNSPYKFTDPLGLISSDTGACGSSCPGSDGGSMGLIGLYSGMGGGFLVTLKMTIVYDKQQYTEDEAKAATKSNLEELAKTYGNVGITFDVNYEAGDRDTSRVNDDGVPARIKNAKDGSIIVFLFQNTKYHGGKAGSAYIPESQQIMIWEGGLPDKKIGSEAPNKLSSWAIAHELGHLFLEYAGLKMDETLGNNVSQDLSITGSLTYMRYAPFFEADPDLPDDFDYEKDVRNCTCAVPGAVPSAKSRNMPTNQQLLKIGAKRVANHLKSLKR
ncbi:MAG: RHS repeat-associated core domain-containing protein [Acidobacteria bacterium]|nr:RHS repeat-associated core domain-containing protein [Acidobacteriota bacterium]